MKWAKFVSALSIIAIIWAVFAGEAVVKKTPRTDRRIVVTYWEKWGDFEADAMRAVVDDFNKSQDRIFVDFQSVTNIGQKAMLATSGGIPPDVAGLFGPNVAQYAYNNAVIPLDELAQEAGIKREDYITQYYDICTYRGKLWALPSCPASTALHYNRKMLADAGWDPDNPPKTIEELTRLDEMVFKKDGDTIKKMGFLPTDPGWWPWAWSGVFGGKLWDGESKITMTTPENIEAFTWMGSFAKRYGTATVQSFQQGFGSFKSPQNAFMDNKTATVLQGVWMANFIEKFNPELDWGAVAFPYPEDRPELANSTIIDLDILVIPRGAKHPKEAFEFIRYVQTQAAMEKLCSGQKKQSPLANVSEEFIKNHPNPFVELFQDLASSPTAYSTPKTPIWPQWADEIKSATEVINGRIEAEENQGSVRAALQAVQDRMQPKLDNVIRRERALGIYPEKGSVAN
ncbi:MAG: ABC transporter substrate-binding protein [Fimbriimonadaceae bacterium]|nr:ABC transporter substrate-binding protein [Fimbriimonadaceae bacterium]